jgi:ParB-like chromosome segregation protein Spo0J
MQRYMGYGKTEEQVAVIFGVSRTTIRQRLALLDAAPEVKRAVESGKLSTVAAAKLTKLPREKQVEELPELLESGSQREKVNGIVPAERERMVGRKKIAKLLDMIDCSPHPPKAVDVLRWLLGESDALESKWTEGL